MNTSGVAELVAAVAGTAFVADCLVVRRRPESRSDAHALGVHAVVVQVFDDQLEFVEQRLAKNDILRPHFPPVLRDEVAQAEVLRDSGIFIVGRHFDEAVGILVGF